MRKIIITVILTVLMVCNVQGQIDLQKIYGRFLEKNVPTFNLMPSAYAKISANFWRLRPFVKFEQRFLLFGESIIHQYDSYARNLHGGNRPDWLVSTQRLEISRSNNYFMRFNTKLGVDFRVLDGTNLRVASSSSEMNWYFGINNEIDFFRRTALKSHVSISGGEMTRLVGGWRSSYNHPNLDGSIVQRYFSSGSDAEWRNSFTQVTAGVIFNVKLIPNFSLRMGVAVSHKFRLNDANTTSLSFDERSGRGHVEMHTTRNILHASVGVHKNFPIGIQNQPQQIAPRQQRIRPTHRALPCPPGQMRHGRSWDRPSSVFNHPTAR